MFRYLILNIVLLSSIVYGNIIEDKVKNIIGDRSYNINSKLIHFLYKDQNKFIINKKIKYYKLFNSLKKNGLLNLKLKKPQDITITYQINSNFMMGYYILNNIMHSLGYNYYLTKEFNKKDDVLEWKIIFKAEYMMDSVFFLKELKKENCKILEINNIGFNNWVYKIDCKKISFSETMKIDINEKVKFQKPLRPYFLKIENNAEVLEVKSTKLNHWFPSIVFFDKDLNILKVIKKNRQYRKFKIIIPVNSKYIKITDLHNLINIKRGLTITVKGKEK
ncbi:MAG: hypothetical protein U9Q30_05025 [Campylobacterota bacterium]|nr:hypothetical protein [Campylobacterota bacterium]